MKLHYSLLLITLNVGWVLSVGIFSNTASVTEKIVLLETLAAQHAYRGGLAASPNSFLPLGKKEFSSK